MNFNIPANLKIGLFLFSKGNEIYDFTADQIEQARDFALARYEQGKAFLEELIDQYEGSSFAMSDETLTNATAAAINGHDDFRARLKEVTNELGGTPAEFFQEVIRQIISDPSSVREMIAGYQPGSDAVCGVPGDFTEGATVPSNQTPWHMQPDDLWDKIWEIAKGEGELVSVIDTGGAPGHEDLKDPKFTLSRVPGEPSGIAGHMHGPHCVGTAVGQNRLGIAPGADYGTVQCLSSRGSGQSNWTAQAIHDSIDNGATVISISIGGGGPDAATTAALIRAQENGVIVVAAAGNDGYQGRDTVNYPAKDSNAAAIASYAQSLLISGFSSGGPDVDVAFPGSDVVSVNFRGGRMTSSGTSHACPGAAGFAAIIQSFLVNHGFARLDGTRDFIAFCNEHATDAGAPGEDNRFGAGIMKIFDVLLENKPDDVGSLAVSPKPSAIGRIATALLLALSFLSCTQTFAQELNVQTIVRTVETTETVYAGKVVNKTKPRLVSEVVTESPAVAIQVGDSQATLIGEDLTTEVVQVSEDGMLLLTKPGKFLVLPGIADFEFVEIAEPEPEFDFSTVESLAKSLADSVGDNATRLALASNYEQQIQLIAAMSIEQAKSQVKRSTIVNVFSRRDRNSQNYDWVNGFQRPLEAEFDRLGMSEWTLEAYIEALKAAIKGLRSVETATVSQSGFVTPVLIEPVIQYSVQPAVFPQY